MNFYDGVWITGHGGQNINFIKIKLHLPYFSPAGKCGYLYAVVTLRDQWMEQHQLINETIICKQSYSTLDVVDQIINEYQKETWVQA